MLSVTYKPFMLSVIITSVLVRSEAYKIGSQILIFGTGPSRILVSEQLGTHLNFFLIWHVYIKQTPLQ